MYSTRSNRTGCVQAAQSGARIQIRMHTAHEIVRGRSDWNVRAGDIEAILQACCVDVPKFVAKNFSGDGSHIKKYLAPRPAGELTEDGAADLIACQKLVHETAA